MAEEFVMIGCLWNLKKLRQSIVVVEEEDGTIAEETIVTIDEMIAAVIVGTIDMTTVEMTAEMEATTTVVVVTDTAVVTETAVVTVTALVVVDSAAVVSVHVVAVAISVVVAEVVDHVLNEQNLASSAKTYPNK